MNNVSPLERKKSHVESMEIVTVSNWKPSLLCTWGQILKGIWRTGEAF